MLITAGTSEAQPVPKMQNAEEVGKAVYVGELIRQPGIDSNCFHWPVIIELHYSSSINIKPWFGSAAFGMIIVPCFIPSIAHDADR